MAVHRFDGEHIYKGILFAGRVTDENIEKVINFSTNHDDILIASYPKTGTTWMSELVCAVAAVGVNEDVLTKHHEERILYLEMKFPKYGGRAGIDLLDEVDRPALIKSHLPADLIEKPLNAGLKTILVVRNPKDTLVSFWNFYKNHPLLGKFTGTFSDFFELHKMKHVIYGNYFDWYESWLPYLDKPNVLLVSYEEMKQDIQGVISRVSKFMGKEINSNQMSTIVDHTSIESMRENVMTNMEQLMKGFIGKGQVGGWKDHFSAEQSGQFDEEYEKRLGSKGLKILFEL